MPVICDTHVHIYPGYSLDAFFAQAAANLNSCLAGIGLPDADCARVLCLAERSGCRMFESLAEALSGIDMLHVSATAEPNSLCISVDQVPLYVIAGRQIVTAERLELLGLGVTDEVEDGLPFKEAHDRVVGSGGLAVLPWSPGKWMFSRFPIVERILRESSPAGLLLGDSALRPLGWPVPRLIALGRARSYTVLPGTDPLPLEGEESRVGAYSLYSPAAFAPERPFLSLSKAVLNSADLTAAGVRLGPAGVFRRLLQLRSARQARQAPARQG